MDLKLSTVWVKYEMSKNVYTLLQLRLVKVACISRRNCDAFHHHKGNRHPLLDLSIQSQNQWPPIPHLIPRGDKSHRFTAWFLRPCGVLIDDCDQVKSLSSICRVIEVLFRIFKSVVPANTSRFLNFRKSRSTCNLLPFILYCTVYQAYILFYQLFCRVLMMLV